MSRHSDTYYDDHPLLLDGSTRDKVVAHPRGIGDRVLTNADIVVKYRSLTRSVIPTDRQTAIERTVLNLDALDDISKLMALLTPTVGSALGVRGREEHHHAA